MPFLLIFLRPCARRATSLEHTCSQRTLYISFEELTIFPVLALRTALILYSGFMVGSAARLISLLTRCCSFCGNCTGVDTNVTDSIFSTSLMLGQVVL